jgi:hypothetical protein
MSSFQIDSNNFFFDLELKPSIEPPSDCVDVLITYTTSDNKDLLPNIPVQINSDGSVNLSEIIAYLVSEGFPVRGLMVFYYSAMIDTYIYCGKEPINSLKRIPAYDIADIDGRKVVYIKVRKPYRCFQQEKALNNDVQQFIEFQKQSSLASQASGLTDQMSQEEAPQTMGEIQPKAKRRERKIGEALEIVNEWRKSREGVINKESGVLVQMNLNQSAAQLGVSRKSLDDYYRVIKKAKDMGVDFKKYKHKGFGALRAFVRGAQKGNPIETCYSLLEDDSDDNDEINTVPKVSSSKKIHKD